MLTFESDYTEGCHEAILKRLAETNRQQVSGYGADPFTQSAAAKITDACGTPEAQVYFLAGGTQTNQLVIDTFLQPWEGVIAATTGHVSVHEAGAIEYTGHKVLNIPQKAGKINAWELERYISNFFSDDNHEHMVHPGMVYITHPTEYGTLYTRGELSEIFEVCRKYSLPLFLDGARLGYGLAAAELQDPAAEKEDRYPDLPFIARHTDVFYIGGTKVGALIGEAVVFTHGNKPSHFLTRVKQHGALLAKGRLIGLQFDTLFTDDLYRKVSLHALEMAQELKELLHRKGYTFFLETPTNQQFIVLENNRLEELKKHIGVSFWEKQDAAHTVVRLATSWATTPEMLEELEEYL